MLTATRNIICIVNLTHSNSERTVKIDEEFLSCYKLQPSTGDPVFFGTPCRSNFEKNSAFDLKCMTVHFEQMNSYLLINSVIKFNSTPIKVLNILRHISSTNS